MQTTPKPLNKRLTISSKPRLKTERTQTAILSAAENHFSRLGFAATRLEDIADELGLTRAALFYHFKDKQTLFDAMIVNAFSSFAQTLKSVLQSEDHSISKRLELAAAAWVDVVVSRPNLSRLLLRFVADGMEHPLQKIFIENELTPQSFFELVEKGRRTGELSPLHDDPTHIACVIIGAPLFYAAAIASLVPNSQFEPLDPVQVAVHKRQTLWLQRGLLGINPREDESVP